MKVHRSTLEAAARAVSRPSGVVPRVLSTGLPSANTDDRAPDPRREFILQRHPALEICRSLLGADAVVVSNHGGRQLEGGLSTVRVLPRIADKAPENVEIVADSGVRTGIDILRMLGLGARGCLIGRAYNYGLAADGKQGVTRALEILQDELLRTMALTGVRSVGELPPDLVESAPN